MTGIHMCMAARVRANTVDRDRVACFLPHLLRHVFHDAQTGGESYPVGHFIYSAEHSTTKPRSFKLRTRFLIETPCTKMPRGDTKMPDGITKLPGGIGSNQNAQRSNFAQQECRCSLEGKLVSRLTTSSELRISAARQFCW
jgi:hypothetical protein